MKKLKITLPIDFNLWLKRLNTLLNEPTNQNLIKVPKVVGPKNKNFYDYCNKEPNNPSLPAYKPIMLSTSN